MTRGSPRTTSRTQRHHLLPVERALMLTALNLDPQFTYTDHEIQCAWRRRKAQVQCDQGEAGSVATVNSAYATLISQAAIPRPFEVRL
jgi:hypothetical protein